jgi:hypothetical protein
MEDTIKGLIYGFIIGSALIFSSQVWKIYRIGYWISNDVMTASIVEGGACIGSLLFSYWFYSSGYISNS